MTLISVFISR